MKSDIQERMEDLRLIMLMLHQSNEWELASRRGEFTKTGSMQLRAGEGEQMLLRTEDSGSRALGCSSAGNWEQHGDPRAISCANPTAPADNQKSWENKPSSSLVWGLGFCLFIFMYVCFCVCSLTCVRAHGCAGVLPCACLLLCVLKYVRAYGCAGVLPCGAPEGHLRLSCPSLHYIFKLSLSIGLRNHPISTSLGSQSVCPET